MPMSIQASAALPCVFSRFSRRLGRAIPLRPAVDCDGVCAGCPWSRAEKQRRRREGRWRRGEDGLLRLHFRPIQKDVEIEEERA
ncbi:MAG: hypothetical protein IJQ42_11650 [Oscillospiraceae bacterium]|jgi:hypothetical protein|nr:hypothetical protein [Oscillospiraceae bacterium]